MMPALVSIIVPVYHVAAHIEKCACTLFEQTYPHIEYIFVDDCGTDNSMDILRKTIRRYPARLPAVTIVKHPENKGLPSARNTGLDVASGKYVLHCDSDDWTHIEWVERLVHMAEESNADIVYSDFYLVYGEQQLVDKQLESDSYKAYLKDFFWGRSQSNVWNKLFRRALFTENAVRFPDGLPMLEDMRTVVQLYYYARRIEYVPLPLYYYVKSRVDSISGAHYQKSKILSMDRVKNIQGIQNFLEEKNIGGLDPDLGILKLGAKHNLLINADHIGVLKQWRAVFPEANRYIWISLLPFYYKLIAQCVLYGFWGIPRCWIWLKKMKNKPKDR